MGRRRRIIVWSIAGVAVLVVAGVAAGPITSRVEQPAYSVLDANGPIELRAYGPTIAAEVTLHGNRSAALSEGFRLIAGYIFGGNGAKAKIAMTAPVEQQSAAPASVAATENQQAGGDAWTVRFIMPRGWTMATLPTPDDPRVTLKPLAAGTMLAIRFSGSADKTLIDAKTQDLRRYALAHGINTAGEPLLAFYNPPWTLPFLRRNEVMFAVERG